MAHTLLSITVDIWKPVLEISILWFVIYHIMHFFEGTRAIQVVRGIVILSLAFFIFERLNFQVLDWLLTKLFGISVIAILIIFQPEIRQGLARLGQRQIFRPILREEEIEPMLKEIGRAAEVLARNKFGALIAIEKNDSLTEFIGSGELIDAKVSSDLIEAIFTPNNPLHDGGLVIQRGRLMAAGCIFPLTQNSDISRIYGTRHRAALGLSDETDAIVIIVSEERQDISLVYQRDLRQSLNPEQMLSEVKRILKRTEDDKGKS
jgi:diadenylate cyclase